MEFDQTYTDILVNRFTSLKKESINRHIGLVGQTGSGKPSG